MLLEIFTNADAPLNIKNISAESPEQELQLHFDPKRDIRESDWEEMNKILAAHSRKGDCEDLFRLAANIADIDPTKTPNLSIADWALMMNSLTIDREQQSWFSLLTQLECISKLDKSKLPIVTSEDWQHFIAMYGLNRAAAVDSAVSIAAMIAAIDQTRLPLITDDDWKRAIEAREKSKSENPYGFALQSVEIATIDKTKLPLVTEEDWRNMTNALDEYRQENQWDKFASMAANLSALSRLVDKASQNPQKITPPLPQTRNF